MMLPMQKIIARVLPPTPQPTGDAQPEKSVVGGRLIEVDVCYGG